MKKNDATKNSSKTLDSNCDLTSHSGPPPHSNATEQHLSRNNIQQARYWIATVPERHFTPHLPDSAQHIRGQLECGAGGFRHWQFVVSFAQKKTLGQLKRIFGKHSGHFEPTRSNAANEYVWKLDTRIGEYL